MTDTGWKSAGDGVSYREKNGIVCVVGESITIAIPANVYTTVGTLPADARPAKNYPFFVDASGIETLIVGRLRTNGQIQIYSKKETTYWNFSISFPV